MSDTINIQIASTAELPISLQQIEDWASAVLQYMDTEAELTIRLVDEEEMTQLNHDYRNINKSTNVLAFPTNIPDIIPQDIPLIGDVVICPTVLERESAAIGISLTDHWAHITTHGILHLLGYDHILKADETIMQSHEINILETFSINNPYES